MANPTANDDTTIWGRTNRNFVQSGGATPSCLTTGMATSNS